jgi:hypothetical protein
MAISRGALPPLNLFVALTNRSIVRVARGEVKRIGDAR